ncbi:MAG TPA: glycosyltransferase family 9 protein [Alphaproteobacteria bacterium]|nr:glycosyltransferase family 9 protein [Alphaproteobacteria bacterium]
MRTILILRPGALGDAVLTLPLVEALLERGAGRIILLGTPASWRFVREPSAPLEVLDAGGRDWLALFGKGVALAGRARALLAEVDAALVLLGRGRAEIERALGAAGVRLVAGGAPAALAEAGAKVLPWAMGKPVFAPWPPGSAHAAQRLLAPLAALAGGAADWPHAPRPLAGHPLLGPARAEVEEALRHAALTAPPEAGILALHPGSGSVAKCWPAERFARLATAAAVEWRTTPVFLIGPADREAWATIRYGLPPALAAHALVERPLREVLALLSLARAYVGNDSGISHLAALACPTLALFGPSDPLVWHPLGRRVAILRAEGGDFARLAPERALDALADLI